MDKRNRAAKLRKMDTALSGDEKDLVFTLTLGGGTKTAFSIPVERVGEFVANALVGVQVATAHQDDTKRPIAEGEPFKVVTPNKVGLLDNAPAGHSRFFVRFGPTEMAFELLTAVLEAVAAAARGASPDATKH